MSFTFLTWYTVLVFIIPILIIFEAYKPIIKFFKKIKRNKDIAYIRQDLRTRYPSICLFFENLDKVIMKINKHYGTKIDIIDFESYDDFVRHLKENCGYKSNLITQSILNAFIDDIDTIISQQPLPKGRGLSMSN